MANKILETLTIGGTPLDIHNYEVLDGGNVSVSMPANTWTNGSLVTVTKTGVYAAFASVAFNSPSTTGAVTRMVRVIGTENTMGNGAIDGTNATCTHSITIIGKVVAGTTIRASGISNRASTGVSRLILYLLHEVGGGNP